MPCMQTKLVISEQTKTKPKFSTLCFNKFASRICYSYVVLKTAAQPMTGKYQEASHSAIVCYNKQ